MAKAVIVLGAGASAHCGAPLMWDFFDRAEEVVRSKRWPDSEWQFRLVFDAIHELSRVYAKSHIDTTNLEAVYSAFELAAVLGRLGEIEGRKIDDLPAALREVILYTLTDCVRFDEPVGVAGPVARGYLHFINALRDPQFAPFWGEASIITFNYDLALDRTLASEEVPYHYALDDSPPAEGSLPVLKLHGSLNWHRDSLNKCIRVLQLPPVKRGNRLIQLGPGGSQPPFPLPLPKPETGQGSRLDPVIVPPSWSKSAHFAELKSVWRAAGDALKDAENILVVGYSLPRTDEFFRYLYALGTTSSTRFKNFVVVDPETAKDGSPRAGVERRFRALLGPLARERFTYYEGLFESLQSARDAAGRPLSDRLRRG